MYSPYIYDFPSPAGETRNRAADWRNHCSCHCATLFAEALLSPTMHELCLTTMKKRRGCVASRPPEIRHNLLSPHMCYELQPAWAAWMGGTFPSPSSSAYRMLPGSVAERTTSLSVSAEIADFIVAHHGWLHPTCSAHGGSK